MTRERERGDHESSGAAQSDRAPMRPSPCWRRGPYRHRRMLYRGRYRERNNGLGATHDRLARRHRLARHCLNCDRLHGGCCGRGLLRHRHRRRLEMRCWYRRVCHGPLRAPAFSQRRFRPRAVLRSRGRRHFERPTDAAAGPERRNPDDVLRHSELRGAIHVPPGFPPEFARSPIALLQDGHSTFNSTHAPPLTVRTPRVDYRP
jgi:hypothetical protein